MSQDEPRAAGASRWRRPLIWAAPVLVILGALYLWISGGRYESTDDAYVQSARVAISPNVAGRVVAINVRENAHVHPGDVLFRLDDAPFRIAVEEARARLAAARLQVESLKSVYSQRQAEVRSAKDALDYQQLDYDRQLRLLKSGIASQAQVDRVLHARDEAHQQVEAAEQQVHAVLAELGGNPNIPLEQHPTVQEAKAVLERAELNLSYTLIHAPIEGVVTKVDQLQVGSYIVAATPVFALVSVHDVWVEANFKEVQLTYMRPGQAATIEVDSYPGKTFHARVASLSPGTGSTFSVLPPENSTGNWVKVVQRLPVRLLLTDSDPNMPLYAGMSANVRIDTAHERHLLGADTASAQAAAP